MVVLNNGDQTTEIVNDAGIPFEDQRRAVRALGTYMNFAVTNNFLGLPCNTPRAMKICVEFYDDPLLAGSRFGPDAYATDATGSVGLVPAERFYTLRGSGEWKKMAWTIPSASLFGVNVTPLTAGPRLFFETGQPFISRFDLAVLRVSPHPLAGQDPLTNCFEDPDICTTNYGNYVEMDLAAGLFNGLAPGTSGGDQEMIQAEAGPAGDRRMAIRPARDDGTPGFAHQYLNLAIQTRRSGRRRQPNAHLAICMTYYDDPALAGQSFRPEVYITDRNGVNGFAFTPGNIAVVLQGTDRWRDAYFELPDVKFNGVNQGPQAAARFFVSGKIFFSGSATASFARADRARSQPAGRMPATDPERDLRVQRSDDQALWTTDVEGWIPESSSDLSAPGWSPVTQPVVVEAGKWVVRIPVSNRARHFSGSRTDFEFTLNGKLRVESGLLRANS